MNRPKCVDLVTEIVWIVQALLKISVSAVSKAGIFSIQAVSKSVQMDIMQTMVKTSAMLATGPVKLAMGNTAQNVFPAHPAGTNKKMDVYRSAPLGTMQIMLLALVRDVTKPAKNVWDLFLLTVCPVMKISSCCTQIMNATPPVLNLTMRTMINIPVKGAIQLVLLAMDPSRCENCHDSCMQCKGPGPLNCTECHLNMKLYLDENRCVPCCKSSELVQTRECCDCSKMQGSDGQKGSGIGVTVVSLCVCANLSEEVKSKATALVIAVLILLSLTTGGIIFIWRRSRAKPKPINQGGYEKLADNAKALSSFKSNHYQSTSYQEDQVIEYKDRDEDYDDDDDDDIVYMGQDGTVYRKFKYGLLEDDEVDELEYDDESYTFR
ncbi:hypothetical protein JD844_009150 [Phrynosoma platyrhinos]|uniref:Proprotein convertase subtilisin/kexin type 5 n=1 Tax=Phrynosoma platyrhinos TaxID=52577 RepID=A0ABQ7TF18_PHRPL|nr:hypothetical protein JD844_009150 [Phrynosoma platyrhinos]